MEVRVFGKPDLLGYLIIKDKSYNSGHGRTPRPKMTSSKCETYYAPRYRKFIEDNFHVREWLKNRAVNTQKCYGDNIRRFCEFANVTPEQFQNMDKKVARDIAWSFIETFSDKPTVAINVMAALKSFYRNHDGETLPFDSSKFGKHYVKPRARKASFEHVPTKIEVYQIIDMATSLRDRAMMLTLFQSGIRLNALLRLNYGHVREQVEKGIVPLHLKITDDLDTKLRGYDLPYYDTFIGKEAVDALKRFCEIRHRNSIDDTPLFTSRNNNRVADTNVWFHIKRCMAHAGFDKRTMWVHSLRKAFKSELRKAPINEELSELLMGHRLRGSRESYMNRNDAVEELRKAYEQADFSRDGKTKETQHETEIQRLKLELKDEKLKTDGVGQYLDNLQTQIEQLQKQLEKLQNDKRVYESQEHVLH